MKPEEQEGISEEGIGEATKQISLFRIFIEKEYLSKLTDNLRKDKNYIEIDYNELAKFNPALAEQLDRTPEDTIKAAELGIEQLDIGDWTNTKVRFFNLPKSANIGIGEVRNEHFNGLYQFEGLIVKVGDITAGANKVTYECPSCGNVINVLQLDEEKLKAPFKCGCGRKGKFHEIGKTWKNVQHIKVEEYITDYTTKKARPTIIQVILENDLANEELTKKLQPGVHVRFTGIVQGKQIKESIFFSFRILCNHIVIEDKSLFNLKVPDSYIKKFKEMKNDPDLIEDISESIFFGIEGQKTIKKILAVSRARGVKSYHQDGRLDQRDTINVGMIGDPGCIDGESYVTLSDGTFKKIKRFGNSHLQKILEPISLEDSRIAKSNYFHKYHNQKSLKIITETGKELICNYNHPLFTEGGWQNVEKLKIGNAIMIQTDILCRKKTYEIINTFGKIAKQGKRINIPLCNEDVGWLWGYIIGDGYVKKEKGIPYRVVFCISDDEKELIYDIQYLMKKQFGILGTESSRYFSTCKIGNRVIKKTKPMHYISFYSKILGEIFDNGKSKDKRVPEIIMNSKKSVVATFLSGLFEADGCCFTSHREDRSPAPRIQLKSSSHKLLLDVQLLLIKFGIQARINQDNLVIALSDDIITFSNDINFTLLKKKHKLKKALFWANRKRKQRNKKKYEKIIDIMTLLPQTVYDIEVPNYHRFISNGILSHNTAKSQMGKMAVSVDIIQMTVSGKGVSGPGLTSTTTHDKELGCWCVEMGAGPRCTNGSLFVDEVDKIDDKDTSALNGGMVNLSFITAKAGGNPVTLPLDTNMVMAANPEGRKFDPMIDKYRQTTLKPDFRDRFDIWVAVEKIVGTKNQDKVIGKIINRFSDEVDSKIGKYDLKFLQYYYAWIIQTFKPKISEEIGIYAKGEISRLMNQAGKDERSSEISYRLVENIIRFGIGIAKILQKDEVTKEDINLSIEFQKHGFKSLDMLDETGQVSVEKIEGQIPLEVTRKKYRMEDIIKDLYNENKGPVPAEDIIKKWVEEGNDEAKGEERLNKMLRDGDCFEPTPGFIRPI